MLESDEEPLRLRQWALDIVGETSPFRVLTSRKVKRRRKLLTSDYYSHHVVSPGCAPRCPCQTTEAGLIFEAMTYVKLLLGGLSALFLSGFVLMVITAFSRDESEQCESARIGRRRGLGNSFSTGNRIMP